MQTLKHLTHLRPGDVTIIDDECVQVVSIGMAGHNTARLLLQRRDGSAFVTTMTFHGRNLAVIG